MNFVLINYVLKAAIRDKLIISVIIMMILAACISIFIGSSAVIEKGQFVSVYIAGSLRIITVIGLVLFICFYIRKSFDNKDVEFILSKPISRISFILSHSFAFTILAFILSAITIFIILGFSVKSYSNAHILWAVSIFVEMVIIVNAAMFFSMVLTSASSAVMATFGFYALSRMIGQLLGIVYSSIYFPGSEILGYVMQIVSMIIPRLDLMAQTSWLIYDVQDDINLPFIIIHGILFSFLLIFASLVDIIRRKF